MTTHAGETGPQLPTELDQGGVATADRSPRLAQVANEPGADPCDVACDAMPGHIVGDLTPSDISWLLTHTASCSYCANMLHSYEQIDDVLDTLSQRLPATPPRWLPKKAPAAPRAGYASIDSPVGPLYVAVTEAGVCEVGFAVNEAEAEFRQRLLDRGLDPALDPAVVDRAATQLIEYFGGHRNNFDVSLDFTGITPFTRDVLSATTEIPFGHLGTYRQIAERVGRPHAFRAVGNALGRNPIPVIVPCHRIVRSDSSLGGYTGGLAIKQRLLSLEGVSLN